MAIISQSKPPCSTDLPLRREHLRTPPRYRTRIRAQTPRPSAAGGDVIVSGAVFAVGLIVYQSQQVSDRTVGFDWVPQRLVGENFVPILAPDLLPPDKASGFEVLDDSLHSSLGDSDLVGDFAEDHLRFGSQYD